MAQRDSGGAHWQALIGAETHGVKGVIEDVFAISDYLQTSSAPVKGFLLANRSLNENSEVKLPTYDNVIAILKEIINGGQHGDYVYIHFSGHGTRMKDGALALVLFHPGPLGSTYMYGTVLRNAINSMMKKGMLVTLVLDCCDSGSVLRHGHLLESGVRYVEYDAAVDVYSNHSDPFANEDEDETRGATYALPRGRDPGQRLLDPVGYTVLAACDSHEEATSLVVGDGTNRGALSYFLLESLVALTKRRAQISHMSLHQHLRASFHARYPHQTPMLYGINGISFFNDLILNQSTIFTPAYRATQGVILDAGEVHGVHINDEYALYEFTTSENSSHAGEKTYMKTRVANVQRLKSELHFVNPSDASRVGEYSTWKAKMLSSFSPRRVRIQLTRSVMNADRILEDARDTRFATLTDENNPTLDDTIQAHSFDETMFRVVVNDDSVYEVQDQLSAKIANFPVLQVHDARANRLLVKALEHIATYKFFEQIENRKPNPIFEASYSLTCDDLTPGSDGYFNITHGDPLTLTFKNEDTVPKYLVILNFSSSWGISNVIYEAGEGNSLKIAARNKKDDDLVETGEIELPLVMNVPEHLLHQGRTEDTMKTFITSKETVFPSMLLPRIDADELRGDQEHMIGALMDLMWGLSGMRGGDVGDWSTQTFLVRTST